MPSTTDPDPVQAAALAQQQQALLALLFSSAGVARNIALKDLAACGGPDFATHKGQELQSTQTPSKRINPWQRGLQAYLSNGQALAERSLATAYPVVHQLLGNESFADLAHALWQACPPTRGDMAHWGGELAQFVAQDVQLAEEPYLADLARLEWALHQAATAQDSSADPASFALFSSQNPAHSPEHLFLQLAPGLVVLPSPWPVVAIRAAHVGLEAAQSDSATEVAQVNALQQAGAMVRARVAQTALVWRKGHAPCVREALPGEPEFLAATQAGSALGAALEASQTAQFDLAQWLPMAVRTGLLWGVEAHSP